MARGLRDLRRKMKAIKSTRQVTKAMELVAASKMRRATENAQKLREYALAAWTILQRIASLSPGMHPYLEERPLGKVLVLLLSTDRGLCGSLNAQLFRTTGRYATSLEKLPSFQKLDFVAVGRKSQQFLSRTGRNVVAAFPAMSNKPAFRDIFPLMRFLDEKYREGTYDHVVLIYPDFISALVQEPTVKVLLPFSKTELHAMLRSILPQQGSKHGKKAEKSEEKRLAQYLFEPSPEQILEAILPQLTEVQLYQSVLGATASEHSARMVAMRSATDNASALLDDLTLTYNQTRQAGITAELSELSAAKAALEQ